MPIIADVVNILQVVDVKAMFLALEGTEDQALFSKMLHLEMVPGFYFQMSSFMHESSHRLNIVESSHGSEQAEALRFLCINADVDAKLPKDYWEQDCRYLIENLEYEVAKQVVESDNLKLDVNMSIAYNDKSNFHPRRGAWMRLWSWPCCSIATSTPITAMLMAILLCITHMRMTTPT